MNNGLIGSTCCLNAEQVAAYLGISRSLVYQLMHENDFPCISVRGRLVVPQERFLEWVEMRLEMHREER